MTTTSPPLPSAPGLPAWTLFPRPAERTLGSSPPSGSSASPVSPVSPAPTVTPADLSGTVLRGRYELVRRIGCGGMGEVYEARFLASGQAVAVKLLFARYAARGEMLARFRHELQVLESIRHPNIVQVRDYDQTREGRPFLVMELIAGEDLARVVARRGPLPIAEVIEIGRQLCAALATLHACGVIHRDLTPRNVLVEGEGAGLRVKVIDLGVCKATPGWYAEPRPYMTPPERRLRTRAGLVLGTPGYTAPEAADRPPSPQQDIYSLGVVLFEMATGLRFPREWLYAIPGDVDVASLGLDRHTWRTLLKAFEPDAAVRYASADAMDEALDDLRLLVGEDEGEEERGRLPRLGVGGARFAARPSRRERRDMPRPSRVWRIAVILLGLYALFDLGLHLRGRHEAGSAAIEVPATSAGPTQGAMADGSGDRKTDARP